MLVNIRTMRIEWGDCDPAGIVFYPRYFEFFDASTGALFERALAMGKLESMQAFAFDGYPMVDTRSRFFVPSRYGEDVTIETTVTAIRRSSFDVHHRLLKDGLLAAEGFETRVWVIRDPDNPGKIRSLPIPQEVIRLLSQG
jgi:4-hydroxybenzoyl-CoA thioesterase